MKNKLNIIFISLYLLSGVFNVGQIVCVSADGQRSIEKYHTSNHCSSKHEIEKHECHIDLEPESDCAPCVDSPLQDEFKTISLNQDRLEFGQFVPFRKQCKIIYSSNALTKDRAPIQCKDLKKPHHILKNIVLII